MATRLRSWTAYLMMKISDSISTLMTEATGTRNDCFWSFASTTVCWVPYVGADEKFQHIRGSIGSLDQFMCVLNELRFDPKTLMLISAVLEVPENTLPKDKVHLLDGVVNLRRPKNKKVIGLDSSDFRNNFALLITEYIHFDCTRDSLFGIANGLLDPDAVLSMIKLHSNLDLVFANNILAGWVFRNACANLRIDDSLRVSYKQDNMNLIRDFYSVFRSENQDKLDEQDEFIKQELLFLLNRLRGCEYEVDGGLSDFVCDSVENALDFYYDY